MIERRLECRMRRIECTDLEVQVVSRALQLFNQPQQCLALCIV
jgi:hypothetical protein